MYLITEACYQDISRGYYLAVAVTFALDVHN